MPSIPYDFHIHCGSERAGAAQIDFIHALEAKEISFAGLLDHYEFYDGNTDPWFVNFRANAKEKGFEQYDNSIHGMHKLYDQLEALRKQVTLPFALGIEIRRPRTFSKEFLERPEYMSNCFHIHDAPDGGSFGERAAGLIREFGTLANEAGMPGIVNHPFRDCLGPYHDQVTSGTAPPPSIYFPQADVDRMTDAAGECGLALEVNLRDINYHAQLSLASKDLMIHLHGALVESGLPLSYGSDAHNPQKVAPNEDGDDVLRQIGLQPSMLEATAKRLRDAAGYEASE